VLFILYYLHNCIVIYLGVRTTTIILRKSYILLVILYSTTCVCVCVCVCACSVSGIRISWESNRRTRFLSNDIVLFWYFSFFFFFVTARFLSSVKNIEKPFNYISYNTSHKQRSPTGITPGDLHAGHASCVRIYILYDE